MKKIIILLIILYGCQEPSTITPAYILLGQSNACIELAEAMQKNTTVKILQYNHGGQPIEQWFDASGPRTKAGQDLSYIYNNITGHYLKAVFWFQGEQNCYAENTQEFFYNYTSGWFNCLLQKYPDIDINIVQIGYNGAEAEVLANIEFIREEQSRLNNNYTGIIIDSSEYNRTDSWHLTPSEYIRLGADVINMYEETK